jgi:hypothetical protein
LGWLVLVLVGGAAIGKLLQASRVAQITLAALARSLPR